MLADRGVSVDHTTMYRWVQRFAPELEKRMRRHLRPCRGPWHVDETYIRVNGRWRYLYRAVDGTGQTIDFLLSAKRDKEAAKRFFKRALGREHTRNPREVVTDRLKSYPGALREMKQKGELWRFARHRRGRWLNNWVEQDHRRIQAPDPAHARLSGLLDGEADAGRHRGNGDAGQGTGACRSKKLLNRSDVQVVHFTGHGDYKANADLNALRFEDGSVLAISFIGTTLGRQAQPILYLNACRVGKTAPAPGRIRGKLPGRRVERRHCPLLADQR